MIKPARSGHRNRAVARDAARQVSTKKDGVRLTWILRTSKDGDGDGRPVTLGDGAIPAAHRFVRVPVHRSET